MSTSARRSASAIVDFQNTQMKLAECKTEATIGKVFVDHCIGQLIEKQLTAETASMAKYWISDLQCKIVDECLQLHGGYGYMNEYPDRAALTGTAAFSGSMAAPMKS